MALNLGNVKKIHCIGIGGIGVSGLAELLHNKGYRVSGSDLNDSAIISRLKSLGIHVDRGHAANHLHDADLIVYSSAVANDNIELQAAKNANIPLILRGQLLAELMQPYFDIAVVGTHGKTTTTGFIAHTFVVADLDPTYVIGGRIRDQQTTVRYGHSRYFIAEADESDQSFLHMRPNIAVITNIEADHLENYHGDFEQLKQAFLQFVAKVPDHGLVVLGIDCPVIRTLLPAITRRVKTFGFAKEADFQITAASSAGLASQFVVQRPSLKPLPLTLNLPGNHNILNALPSVVIAQECQISDEILQQSLKKFPGMGRRFHPHGELSLAQGKAWLFEDYGHHPSAIAATIDMAKQAWPQQRVVLVFQPHRYSRTRDLMNDFVRVLGKADALVLLNVYAASEQQDVQGSAEMLYAALQKANIATTFIPQMDAAVAQLPSLLQPNDIVIFQGAGDVGSLATKLKDVH